MTKLMSKGPPKEKTFFIKPLNEHFLAGLQYALGDLKADDTPSAKAGTR